MCNYFGSVIILFCAILKHGSTTGKPFNETLQTCSVSKPDGVNTFTLRASSTNGDIPLIHIQFDVKRKLPITSTYIQNNLNVQQEVERQDHFRMVKCESLTNNQQNCAKTFKVSEAQRPKLGGEYNSWDRGHLTPANPMRFSSDALDVTFYCVNMAPQEPWTNRCPWYAVEERVLSKAKSFPSFVITGVCPKDNKEDGLAEYGYIVPECFWKLNCYVDPVSMETKVIAWIGQNLLIDSKTKENDKAVRKEETLLPRPQQEVLKLMGTNKNFVEEAWLAAGNILTQGRNKTGMPNPATCYATTKISNETKEEWKEFMKKHRPPFYCFKKR